MKLKTKKGNELLPNIPTSNITELKERICAKAKLVSDKIGIPQRNPNKNTKSESKIRRERMTKNYDNKQNYSGKKHKDILG